MKKAQAQASAPAKKAARVVRAMPRAAAAQVDVAEAGGEELTTEQRLAGQRLINMIRTEVINRGLPERHPADLMGITTVYWNSLANGHRPIARLPKEKLKRLADFLHVPLIQVYILSGHFDHEDFVVSGQHVAELESLVESLRRHPRWGPIAPTPEEWAALTMRAKLLIASLYEELSHKRFLQFAEMELKKEAS